MRTVFLERPSEDSLRRYLAERKQFKIWLPVFISLAVIAVESTDTLSAQHTGVWLRPYVEDLLGPMSNGQWSNVHHVLRKAGHFIGYALVCATLLRAWLLVTAAHRQRNDSSWRLRASALAILCTACAASLDEVHQLFLPNRTGASGDVLLDTSGGLLFCCCVLTVARMRAAGRSF